MKQIKYLAIVLLLAGGMVSCSKNPSVHTVPWEELKGTQWRLYEILRNYGHPDDSTIKLEPRDCDTCYTLTFDAEKTGYITGVSILNTVEIQVLLGSEYQGIGFPMVKISITELDEPFDGNMYSDFMKSLRRVCSTRTNLGFLDLTVGDVDRIYYLIVFERINH